MEWNKNTEVSLSYFFCKLNWGACLSSHCWDSGGKELVHAEICISGGIDREIFFNFMSINRIMAAEACLCSEEVMQGFVFCCFRGGYARF